MRLERMILSGILLVSFTLAAPPTPAISRTPSAHQTAGALLVEPDPLVQAMIDQVDPQAIYTLTGDLSGEWPVTIDDQTYTLDTRYTFSGEPIQKAAAYLYEYYQGLGLGVTYQDFTFGRASLSNVVAEKPGSVFAERVFLITSHYDDVPSEPPAPGADDNASGTVGVMLAAKILSEYDFGCTLRFVNFAAEEQGLAGSAQYAHQAYCAGEDLRGVINLDMIAWNTPNSPTDMELHAHPSVTGSVELADLYQEVVAAYGLELNPQPGFPLTSASDHASFWRYGIPAILVIEDLDDFNPYYHSGGDRLGNLDMAFYAEMVKASLATLAHLGCLVEEGWGAMAGTATDATTGQPIAGASISLFNPAWGYTFYTASAGKGEYSLAALAGVHTLTFDAVGYAPGTVPNVTVIKDQTTLQNIALVPIEESVNYLALVGAGTPASLPGCP